MSYQALLNSGIPSDDPDDDTLLEGQDAPAPEAETANPHTPPAAAAAAPQQSADRQSQSEDFTRWPGVPRNRPVSEFEGVLDDTSLAEPTLPPGRQTRVRQTQLVHHIQHLADNVAAGNRAITEGQQNDREQQKEFDDRANRKADELYKHYITLDNIWSLYDIAISHFKQQEPKAYDEFKDHARRAYTLTESKVRFYDVLRWHNCVPRNVKTAVARPV